MNAAIDVTDAASRLAEFADEAIHFFQKLFSHEASALRRVEELESLSKLAKEIHLKPSTNDDDSPEELEFMKQVLLHCSEIIRDILTEFDWTNIDRLNESRLLSLYDDLNGNRASGLFEDLEREQMCLTVFRESEWVIKSICYLNELTI